MRIDTISTTLGVFPDVFADVSPSPPEGIVNGSGISMRLLAIVIAASWMRRESSSRKSVDTSTSASVTRAGSPMRTSPR